MYRPLLDPRTHDSELLERTIRFSIEPLSATPGAVPAVAAGGIR